MPVVVQRWWVVALMYIRTHTHTQVFDKYLSFISLESSLFSLGLHNTYVTLNDPRMTDQEIEVCGGVQCVYEC